VTLDISIHKGNAGKPVVIFIHGLGMDKNIWISPLETKIFARNIPLKIFAATRPKPRLAKDEKRFTFGDIPDKVNTLWAALQDRGFNLVCWSQTRPVGPIGVAVEELDEIVKRTKRLFPGKPIALIGHSRGGLIARKFMERKISGIKALITISTPHAGSALARFGEYLSPLSRSLKNMLPRDTHGTVSNIIKNIAELVQGNAPKELLPSSDFFKNLKDSPQKDIYYISFGGIKTELLTLYTWRKKDDRMYTSPLLTIPDSLIKIFPASIIPEELTPGKGDVLVSAKSSVLPWASRHCNLSANHISIMWHLETINNTTEVLEKI
jgi:pimeloyl-ACP methyl ester carboxylesterase